MNSPVSDSLKLQIKQIIVDALNIDNVKCNDIEDNVSLWGDGLGLDSIDALEIIVALERNFNVRFLDEDIENGEMRSVNTIAGFVLEKSQVYKNFSVRNNG